MFAPAHEYGRARGNVLSAQMKAMLGGWRGHVAILMWYRPEIDDLLLSPLFAAQLSPLLVRQDQLAHPHGLRPVARLKEYAPAPVRALVAEYEAGTAEPGFRITFGGPELDVAVHAVADRLAGQPAFQVPGGLPIRTGPIVVTLYAGGGPRPEPDPLSDPAKNRAARAAPCDEAWPELRAALRL
ncbi:hypothetical protein LK07_00265 [Streptomyces pluripotens]|uniref:Uncharacterized protein n=1 Tax=Streptomyces pluripotens TaxID=1355015 RepID=A0A221NRX5_9ACTN|nr:MULTISPECIES: hypothetical protein [Streptomyces]ASN22720.1 hypothetical protein LK07_00265 [Streptomyces pluripotens]KIE23218.1 hypothetical protein LK08_31140 [Streptomyces sp. MUSC 125]